MRTTDFWLPVGVLAMFLGPDVLPGFTLPVATTAPVPKGRLSIHKAEQFIGNVLVDVYVLPNRPVEGSRLGKPVRTVRTTADGELHDVDLGRYPRGVYWVVVDYDRDGVYVPRLDAATELMPR